MERWPEGGLREAVKRLAWLAGGRGLAALLGLSASILLARRFGPAMVGSWAVALALFGYAVQLSELGLRSVLTAEAARDPARARATLPTYLHLRLTACALLGLLLIASGGLLPAAQAEAAPWMLLALCAVALQLDWIALARDRSGAAAALLLVRPATWVAFLALMPSAGMSLGLLAAGFAACWWAAAAASWTTLRWLRGAADAAALPARLLLRRGIPLAAVNLTGQAQLALDLLLVGAVLGPVAAGHYYLAGAILSAGLVAANAANQIALARMAPLRERDFRRRLVRELALAGTVAAAGAVFLLLAGRGILSALFGDAFAPAFVPLLALLPWYLLYHIGAVMQGALAARARERELFEANLALLLVLLPLLALAAAAADPVFFGLARGGGELARVLLLALRLDLPGVFSRTPGGHPLPRA